MLSKSEIKDIQSLSQKKNRDALKLFVAEGPKIVNELIQLAPGMIENVFASRDWMEANGKFPAVREISELELERISQLQTPNQVLAVLKKFNSIPPSSDTFTIYLDTIQDPGNFGTIIRTADWFGIRDIVCSKGCADLYNPKVVQATMASIARVNVYYDEKNDWLHHQENIPIYAAVLNGAPLDTHQKVDKGILIIGNESKGISDEVLQFATNKITIPRIGKAESLNAAVATGIILSQLVKTGT
jgi:RNA methyltransferase, TrmH family